MKNGWEPHKGNTPGTTWRFVKCGWRLSVFQSVVGPANVWFWSAEKDTENARHEIEGWRGHNRPDLAADEALKEIGL